MVWVSSVIRVYDFWLGIMGGSCLYGDGRKMEGFSQGKSMQASHVSSSAVVEAAS